MNILTDYNLSKIAPGSKILFANFPADGHFNPLTGLAVHLKSIGCDVRWYTSPIYSEKIRSFDIPFYGFKKAVDVGATMGDIDKIFPERKNIKGQVARLKFDMINAFILRSPEYYQDIQEIYLSFPFEVMIADITFGGIPFVKEKMNIPVVAVDVIPLPETSKDLPPSGLGMTPSYSTIGQMKQAMLRFVAGKILFAGPTKVMWNMLKQYGIDSNGAGIFDILIRKSTIVLQSGTPGFEYKRSDMSRHIHFIGPLLPYSKKQSRGTWFNEKLRNYEKIILVTQGTVERDYEKIIVPTLEAFRDQPYLVIVTTGGSGTSDLIARFPQENFIIEDFIPFNDVMPYADVYITNGGYGGVLLSIQNRLPLVVAGIHEGKNEINARVGYFELGINLKTEKPTSENIRLAVEKVISNPLYSQNVIKLSEEFNKYDPLMLAEKHIARVLKKANKVKLIREQEEVYIY